MIQIRKLEPELATDYVEFFDRTPHDDNVDAHKCYCVCWSNDDFEGKDFSSVDTRREYALQYVREKNIQGYLAYHDNEIVGWCNTNTKMDCMHCCSWQRFMEYVPIDEISANIKIKSIYCFVINPDLRRKGIATQLLERVCKDATDEGFDFVEAYPFKDSSFQSSDFGGHYDMFHKNGFELYFHSPKGLVMRKPLK